MSNQNNQTQTETCDLTTDEGVQRAEVLMSKKAKSTYLGFYLMQFETR